MTFKINNKFKFSSHHITELKLCSIRLHDNSKYSNKNLVAIINKNIPNNLLILFLSILCTVLAPILAIKVVIGINIRNAGIFKKPALKGKFVFK